MSHRTSSGRPYADAEDDDTYVDFSSVGLYLVGLQTVSTTGLVSAASVAVAFFHNEFASAVRSLAICAAITVGCLWRPVRVNRVAGLNAVFGALRPAPVLFVLSLAAGQLAHSCTDTSPEPETPFWRSVLFHALQTPLIFCGMWRAARPVALRDGPVVVCASTLLVLSMVPLPAARGEGPLCAVPTLASAALRVLRGLLFSFCYSFHVFASAPCEFERGEIVLSATRAAAASVWILGAHPYALPCALLQMIILVHARLSIERGVDGVMRDLEDDVVAEGGDAAHSTAVAARYCNVSIHSDGDSDPEQGGGAKRGEGMFSNICIDSRIREAAREGAVVVAPCEAGPGEYLVEAAAGVLPPGATALLAQGQPALTPRGTAWRDLNSARGGGMTPQRMALIAESIS